MAEAPRRMKSTNAVFLPVAAANSAAFSGAEVHALGRIPYTLVQATFHKTAAGERTTRRFTEMRLAVQSIKTRESKMDIPGEEYHATAGCRLTPAERGRSSMRLFRASRLQFATAMYGLLYLAFVVFASIPSTRGLIIGTGRPASVGLELVLTWLLFILFLLGCIASWRSKLIAGMIFFLWYALVWWPDSFSIRYGAGGGMGPALGLPVFIFGILFVVSGVQEERRWLSGRIGRS